MNDFYAQLEHQLVEAGRRRTTVRRWRGALAGRGRPLLAVATVLIALVAAVALAPALRSGSSPGTAGEAAPVPPATSPIPAPLAPPTLSTALRGTVVAVLNGTTTTGLAREVADLLHRHGATLDQVGSAAEQTLSESVVEFRPGMEQRGEAVARLLGVRNLRERDAGAAVLAPRADIVVSIGADRREP